MKKKNNLNPELLVISKRGRIIENLFYGWICVINKDKEIVYKKGNVNDVAFLRSCAKPIQAIPVIESEINLSKKELAIICGSHIGSKNHLKVLNEIINKNGLNLKQLRCGVHLPFDDEERIRLTKKNLGPNVLHNNCSGKHLGMLCVCKKNKYSLNNYLSPNHPLQGDILNHVVSLSECKSVNVSIDGCGLPTFSLPIINIAKMFSKFSGEDTYMKIIDAMTSFPYMVGGRGQIDSEVMRLSEKKMIAKVGADGIIIAAYDGNVLLVKIADGSPKIRAFTFLKMLVKLKWIKEKAILESSLKNLYLGEIKNIAGRSVGKIEFV